MMKKSRVALLGLTALVALSACQSDGAPAAQPDVPEASPSAVPDEVASEPADDEGIELLLSGQVIDFVIPYAPGGGYDTGARVIAPYLAEELDATINLVNQPGAGGLLAINQLTTQQPDGLTIAIMNGVGALGGYLGGAEGMEFEPDELTYLGGSGNPQQVLAAGTSSAIETWEDLISADRVTMASTGAGASGYVNSVVISALFELNDDQITGFEGSDEAALAVVRGDVDVVVANYITTLPLIEDGDLRPIAILSPEAPPELADVPTVLDFDLPDPSDETVLAAHIALYEFGRPIVAPAGMDEALRDHLRTAISNVYANPDFIAEAQAAGVDTMFLSGEWLQESAVLLANAPQRYVDLVAAGYGN